MHDFRSSYSRNCCQQNLIMRYDAEMEKRKKKFVDGISNTNIAQHATTGCKGFCWTPILKWNLNGILNWVPCITER